ncbi:MAG: twin-arginine translocase TatA/TatE family subunit [Myxococcota bacterium]|jgi:sec-independent protein translocase protein TatA|nr:twin-arginine translocase TatA/TatE family subunit [Myxococcota bacterium]
MFGIGIQELAIVCVVALLVFGPKRLPEVARSLGKGLSEFRRASNDLKQSFNLDTDPKPPTPPADAANPRTSEQEPEKPPQLVDAAQPEPSPPASTSAADPKEPEASPAPASSEKVDPDRGA